MKLNTVLFIGILALAAFLRFYNLGSVPPSASLDEASIGYNAYSVLKTGGDEYGEFPFISQRGYDDWRRSTYLLLVVPFINIFDLNVLSVRFPSVILSILTVWASYHIVLNLFSKRSPFAITAALVTALLLAISPWHIYISRLGHESNACLFFLVFGVLFFLQGEKNKSKGRILLSMIFFTLSMVSYYSGQVFIPLFVAGSLFIFKKNLLLIITSSKKILIPIFIFSILLIPIFWAIFSPKALIRFQGTSTFKPEVHLEMFAKRVELRNKAVEKKDIVGALIYNRHLFPFKVFVEGYFSHFNPQWLFTNSSSEPFKVPSIGLLYLWELPIIIIGIITFLFSGYFDGRIKKFIFLWFLLAPIPASIATQAPHAMRFYNALPTWQIFSALGFVYIFYRFRKFSTLILFSLFFVVLISILSFYRNYFTVFPKTQSDSFQYSLHSVIKFVLNNEKSYKKIVFSNENNLYQSYMFYLFDSKYNPYIYQKLGGTKSGGFAQTHKFAKYEFRPIAWSKDQFIKNTLFVGNAQDFPNTIPSSASFANLGGKGVIRVVQN